MGQVTHLYKENSNNIGFQKSNVQVVSSKWPYGGLITLFSWIET